MPRLAILFYSIQNEYFNDLVHISRILFLLGTATLLVLLTCNRGLWISECTYPDRIQNAGASARHLLGLSIWPNLKRFTKIFVLERAQLLEAFLTSPARFMYLRACLHHSYSFIKSFLFGLRQCLIFQSASSALIEVTTNGRMRSRDVSYDFGFD
jgi:hypothetical protein